MTYTWMLFSKCPRDSKQSIISWHALVCFFPRCTHNDSREKIFIKTYLGVLFSKCTQDNCGNVSMTCIVTLFPKYPPDGSRDYLLITCALVLYQSNEMRAENKFSWWPTFGCYSQNAKQKAAEIKFLWWYTLACSLLPSGGKFGRRNNHDDLHLTTSTRWLFQKCARNGSRGWRITFHDLHMPHLMYSFHLPNEAGNVLSPCYSYLNWRLILALFWVQDPTLTQDPGQIEESK